jgi:hypothetical protein
MKQKIEAWLDVNDDGEVTVEDLSSLVVRHEWMFAAGLFILFGAIYNLWQQGALVDGTINGDAFWAAAGLAAILEYIEDIRRRL